MGLRVKNLGPLIQRAENTDRKGTRSFPLTSRRRREIRIVVNEKCGNEGSMLLMGHPSLQYVGGMI
jgi:hypothetical protein